MAQKATRRGILWREGRVIIVISHAHLFFPSSLFNSLLLFSFLFSSLFRFTFLYFSFLFSGSPHNRYFRVSPDLLQLVWGESRDNSKQSSRMSPSLLSPPASSLCISLPLSLLPYSNVSLQSTLLRSLGSQWACHRRGPNIISRSKKHPLPALSSSLFLSSRVLLLRSSLPRKRRGRCGRVG